MRHAEHCIGSELQAAQDRGEIARSENNLRHGSEVQASDIGKATLSQLGIPRQRAAEMKQLAAAGKDAINTEVDEATAENRCRCPSRITKATGQRSICAHQVRYQNPADAQPV